MHKSVEIDVVGVDEDVAARDHLAAGKFVFVRRRRTVCIRRSDFLLPEFLNAAADIENALRVGLHHAAGGFKREVGGRGHALGDNHDVARALDRKRAGVVAHHAAHDNRIVGLDRVRAARGLVGDGKRAARKGRIHDDAGIRTVRLGDDFAGKPLQGARGHRIEREGAALGKNAHVLEFKRQVGLVVDRDAFGGLSANAARA